MSNKIGIIIVSEKGEITIPIKIRTLLNLKPGQKMIGTVKNNAIFLFKDQRKNIRSVTRLKP